MVHGPTKLTHKLTLTYCAEENRHCSYVVTFLPVNNDYVLEDKILVELI
jgi:hypothetical protein